MPNASSRLRVYVDADVLIASAASPSEHSAGQVVLSLSEVTLIDAITSELAIEECRRNLSAKMPDAVPTFELLVTRSIDVVPAPSKSSVRRHTGRAEWKDLPHLVAALEHDCTHLVSYNTRDYEPGHPEVQVLTPGAFVRHIRERLSRL
jgi:hypothetical protein